jgi:hypothetical protein
MAKRWASACWAVALGLLAMVGFAANPAGATTYPLNIDLSSGGLGILSAGTVAVTEDGSGGLDFLVTLNAGVNFVETGNIGFTFSLVDITSVTFDPNPPTDWTILQGAGPYHSDGSGDWDFGLECDKTANGSNDANCGLTSLEFNIKAAVPLSLSSLELSTGGYLFAADVIVVSSGLTGLMAADCSNCAPPPPVPLPAALPLFGSALLASGMVGWWRRRAGRVTFAPHSKT